MKFSDGMEFDLSGPMRIEERSDGLYVVGNNMLIPVNSIEAGLSIIRKDNPNYEIDENLDGKVTVTYKGGTEDMPYRREILVNGESYLSGQTSQEEQQEIADFLGVETKIDEMYEPNQLAEVLGYDSVQDLAAAIAEEYGVELTIGESDDNNGDHNPYAEPTFESYTYRIIAEGNSIKDLVGKDEEDELDLDDARAIGRKISKMKGDDRKKYVGIVNFMGASCRIYNEIWANYKPVDPSTKKSNRGKEFQGDKNIG
jgi:hypothetical protein